MNIVEAQNKVLSNCFGVDCYITEFNVQVPVDIWKSSYAKSIPVQGLLSSYIRFVSTKEIPCDFINKQGCCIMGYEIKEGVIEYYAILLYRSNLRKKLLKAMLKYN